MTKVDPPNRASPWRWLTRLGGFGLVFVVMYALIVLLWGTLVPPRIESNLRVQFPASGHTALRLREAAASPPVDVLSLGSSHMYRGVDTRVLATAGVSAFNLGTSSQSHLQTGHLLDRCLPTLQPRLAVYDVSPDLMQGRGEASALDLALSSELSPALFRVAIDARSLIAFNTLVYRLLAEPLGLYSIDELLPSGASESYIPGGYVRYTGTATYAPPAKPLNPKPLTPESQQLSALRQNVARLRAAGVQVQLIRAPVPEAEYVRLVDTATFNPLMRAIAPFTDYTGRVPLTDTAHFYDATHLTHVGAQRFSQVLANDVRQWLDDTGPTRR